MNKTPTTLAVILATASLNAATTLEVNFSSEHSWGVHKFPNPNGDLQYANYMTYTFSPVWRDTIVPNMKFDPALGTLHSVEVNFSTTLKTTIQAEAEPGSQIVAGFLKTTVGWSFSDYGDYSGVGPMPYETQIEYAERRASWSSNYAPATDLGLLPDNVYGSYSFDDVQDINISTGVITDNIVLAELQNPEGITFLPSIELQSFFADENFNNVITDMDVSGTNPVGFEDGYIQNGWVNQEYNYGSPYPLNFEVIYTYTPVPEPSSALLGLLGVGMLARRKRD